MTQIKIILTEHHYIRYYYLMSKLLFDESFALMQIYFNLKVNYAYDLHGFFSAVSLGLWAVLYCAA